MILEKIVQIYYKKQLEKRVGHRLPSVKVLGRIFFDNGTIEIGENVILWPGVTFSGNGHISIGSNCKIGQNTIIYANRDGGVEIGNDVIIAAQNYIIDSNHSAFKGMLIREQSLVSKKIIIGNDVWIGTQCSIVMGAEIKDGAVIGAKSLVNHTIEKDAIAFGIPACEKKKRMPLKGHNK